MTSALNCSIGCAHIQFEKLQMLYHHNTQLKKSHGKNVCALHIIQSFKGYECSAEQAHKIALELIEKQYGKHVQAVIATHIDKDNLHNHIVLNSVDFRGKKIYNDKANRNALRLNSDSLCCKHGLSVIENPLNYGLNYSEWRHRKNSTSWKERIRNDIDRAVLYNDNRKDFTAHLREAGYKVNDNPGRKYVTIEKEGYRPVRLRTLGYYYEEENIKKRLADPNKLHIDYAALQAELDVRTGSQAFNGRIKNQAVSAQYQSFAVFAARKRTEYSMKNSAIALQYLSATELIYRLIVNNLIKRTRKFDISSPYSLMNDYHFRRNLQRLAFIEKYDIKTRAQYPDGLKNVVQENENERERVFRL